MSAENDDGMDVLTGLEQLAALVGRGPRLYVRWSTGPGDDLLGPASIDELTGVRMPGLSASPLAVEPWWGDRPATLWVARRIYDYVHLRADKGPGVRPWVLSGDEAGRGPDNEPLVRDVRPVAWLGEPVIEQAMAEVERAHGAWGPLRRSGAQRPGERQA